MKAPTAIPGITRFKVCALSLAVITSPISASAQRTVRESFQPYNLICQLSGELGQQRLVFHVEDVAFKLLYLPTVMLGGKALSVDVFDSNSVKGSLDDGVPGFGPKIVSAEFDIDRNTGTLSAHFHEGWQVLPATPSYPASRFRLNYAASGTCSKAAQVF